MYPPELVAPMKSELENAGFESLTSIDRVDEVMNKIENTYLDKFRDDSAVLIDKTPEKFIEQIAGHRNWSRQKEAMSIPV